MSHASESLMRADYPVCLSANWTFCYFVECEDAPGVQVFTLETKLREVA